MIDAFRGTLACLLLVQAVGWTPSASANQDDVPVVLDAPDALFLDEAGTTWLAQSKSSADIAVYPDGSRYHTWHGRLAGDISIVQIGRDALVRMGLAMQTVADHRNEISFRLVRLYYEATQLVEHRWGPGVLHYGVRHRCNHGADAAVAGPVLIRSGPELGYRFEADTGGVGVTAPDPTRSEILWCCYAWPASFGNSGRNGR